MSIIANPQVLIDDVAIFYKAGTGSYTAGTAERTTRMEVNGLEKRMVSAADLSGAFGVIKFELENTPENVKKFRELANNYDVHTVKSVGNVDDGTSDFDATLLGAVVVNRAEIAQGVDGMIEVEFHGNDQI
jgi:hypothetical protein